MTTDTTPATTTGQQLDERDLEILAFERHWWKYAGARDAQIRERFGFGATRYFQILNVLIDNPAALAADPLTVRRLQRVRRARQEQRSARRRLG